MKFIDKIKSDLLQHKKIAGIYASYNSETNPVYDIVFLEKEKEKIKTTGQLTGLTIDGLSEEITDKTPVFLSISGRGIVHKKVEITEDSNDADILNKILPNASIDDFYLQKQEISEKHVYASIVRKEFVDKAIEDLAKKEIQIIDISLGPFSLNNIIPLLNDSNELLEVSNFKLKIDNQSIVQLQRVENENSAINYNIDDEIVQGKSLIPFASALSYYIKGNMTDFTHLLTTKTNENLRYKKIFTLSGWAALVFFFVLLLINYFLYEHYNSSYNTLTREYFQNEKLLTELSDLKNEFELKEQFISSTGLLNPSKFSYFADRIAIKMPGSIVLTNLNIQPLKGRVKKQKEINYTENQIIVEGYTTKSRNIDKWIKILEDEDWILNTEIQDITKEEKSNYIIFSLLIHF